MNILSKEKSRLIEKIKQYKINPRYNRELIEKATAELENVLEMERQEFLNCRRQKMNQWDSFGMHYLETDKYGLLTNKQKGVVKMWTKGVPVEDEAMKQLSNCAQMPFIYKWIAAMPDVHWGMGATVGSVIPTKKAIIPAAVGVDIGCGMMACKIPMKLDTLDKDRKKIRELIEKAVPHGRTDNGGPGDRGAWGTIPEVFNSYWEELKPGYEKIAAKHGNNLLGKSYRHPAHHLGTLGTGNHFIEVCHDEVGSVWVMLHSGSRGIGNKIGRYFISLAKKDMERWFINLPDKDLAYIPEGSELFDDYMEAIGWAQEFARYNRLTMVNNILSELRVHELIPNIASSEIYTTAVNCHHNYVNREHHFGHNVWVTRKGAVSARKGQLGIIPGSMGDRSYIVKGRGNPESFMSCSHGAGRAMSRAEARKKFTLEDHRQMTEGVECRKDEEVLDETPGAYKDIDAVMDAQKDLIEVVHVLKQVVCVKG